MNALAYPLSIWVRPGDGPEPGDIAPMEAALDVPWHLWGPSAWTTESASNADEQLFQQQYSSSSSSSSGTENNNEEWFSAEEFVGAENELVYELVDMLQCLSIEDQVDELVSAVQRLTIK